MYKLFYKAGVCTRRLPARPPILTNDDPITKGLFYHTVRGNVDTPFYGILTVSWGVSLVRNSNDTLTRLDSNRWAACLSARGLAVTLE